MSKTIYYPRIPSINFYDAQGVVTGGMAGGIARAKFWKLVWAFRWPRLSFSKRVNAVVE